MAAAGSELLEPDVLLAGAGLALLIPLLPFVLELIALRRLPTALFGVLMSLEPAIATLLGFVVLGQDIAVAGVVAIAMVSVASAGAALSGGRAGGAGRAAAAVGQRPGRNGRDRIALRPARSAAVTKQRTPLRASPACRR